MNTKDMHFPCAAEIESIRLQADMARSRAMADGVAFAVKAIFALPRKISLLFAGKHPA
ncbi:hypothetical protein TRL7639_01554 [Falsiruegeria litorea R37]|uniref:Uncharacterized protein n=1 Tax=Falsiruegeria litorea R37 TaxID=1200284 RepID=A0A1Y5SBP5_9RHOB|nr:hypothetical protein [Falsiruegeria litorea]SLN34328.1 hypothetical protein TRL7639_01554 [Falsiruegeria litorea R37]